MHAITQGDDVCCPRCPLYLRDSPRWPAAKWRADCGLLLRWAARPGWPGCCLSPVGIRLVLLYRQGACQSFCLSVQTAAISNSAPSAAICTMQMSGGSLLTGANSTGSNLRHRVGFGIFRIGMKNIAVSARCISARGQFLIKNAKRKPLRKMGKIYIYLHGRGRRHQHLRAADVVFKKSTKNACRPSW